MVGRTGSCLQVQSSFLGWGWRCGLGCGPGDGAQPSFHCSQAVWPSWHPTLGKLRETFLLQETSRLSSVRSRNSVFGWKKGVEWHLQACGDPCQLFRPNDTVEAVVTFRDPSPRPGWADSLKGRPLRAVCWVQRVCVCT